MKAHHNEAETSTDIMVRRCHFSSAASKAVDERDELT